MIRFYGLLIVLLIGIAAAGWMAAFEAEKRHKEACTELHELRSTIAAGGKVEL